MIDDKVLYSQYDARPIIITDIVPLIMPLLREGYVIREDGKIAVPEEITSIETDAPWIYVRPHPEFNCGYWHKVLYSTLHIFPKPCLSCWKVVVRPRTIEELLKLYYIQTHLTKIPCKCGIEVRDYVPARYGGYFYNIGAHEGMESLDIVRALVYENISPDVPVYLKRYCTEYELSFGPSDKIEETLSKGFYTDPDKGHIPTMDPGRMQILQRQADLIFSVPKNRKKQPDFIKHHIIANWFKWAWAGGDMTVKKFTGGDDLYSPAVKYEKKNITLELPSDPVEAI